ncbi:hypothetical protein ASD30_00330 [Nocardioides sp. Root140]|nr:hypothetical protein ASD30_00330 [Nocardioides sp. Root140]
MIDLREGALFFPKIEKPQCKVFSTCPLAVDLEILGQPNFIFRMIDSWIFFEHLIIESAIMRTTFNNKPQPELAHHRALAEGAGVSDELIHN